MKLKSAGKSHIGLKRKLNEDSYLLSADMGLYVIADGMGGHKAGEIASKIVIDTLNDYWMKVYKNDPPLLMETVSKDLPDKAGHLINSISLANLLIHEAQKKPRYYGMGSTVSALLADKNRIWSSNVGDSRVYLSTAEHLSLISEEHSLEAEQKNIGLFNTSSPAGSFIKNMLTRALGLTEKVDIFITSIEPRPGDKILMCSDGLTNYLSEEDINGIISNTSFNIEQKVDALINSANEGGGGDNITVILVEVLEEGRWSRFRSMLKLQ
jgi:PPM family protein phosphatase